MKKLKPLIMDKKVAESILATGMTILSGEDLRRQQEKNEVEAVRFIAEAENAERTNYKLKVIKK